jgi:predicted PurR-regulated permease PerM
VGHRLNRAIGGFFRGQLVVAAIVGVLCSIGLGVIGLKFWFLIGMIAGLFNVIPLIGPWVGGIPGVTIALTTGSPLQALLVILVMVGVQQIDNHFITPQVMQRTVHLHPAVVILALVAGGSLAGFFGLLLAVPVAAVLKILISHVWRTYVLEEPVEPWVDPHAAADHDAEGEGGIVEDIAAHPENQGDPPQAVLRT